MNTQGKHLNLPKIHNIEIFIISKTEHEDNIKTQFGLRSSTFNRSAHWITNDNLKAAHVLAAGTPGRGLAMCCGTGITGKALVDAGWDMIGVDLTPEMVNETKKLFPAILGNVESLPFDDNSFDLVVMRQAYFLLADGPAVLKEARRLLKSTGRIVISQILPYNDLDAPWLKEIHQVKQAQMIKFFTEKDMVNELEKYGFKVFNKLNVTVRESVSLWMNNAPELSTEVRDQVCQMVLNAPEDYKKIHNIEYKNGEVIEDWNFAIFAAGPNKSEDFKIEKSDSDIKIINQFSMRIKTYNHAANWMLNPKLLKAHVEMLGPGKEKKCLELCCGTGIVGEALKLNHWDMTGVDLTPEMVEVANKIFPSLTGSTNSLPFESNSFDAAVLRQAFMLLDETPTLKEVHRVLKPRGEFVLCQSVPFGDEDDVQYEKIQWARHINMKNYNTTDDLITILEANGFEVIDTVFISIEESIDKWLKNAPELSPELRTEIYNLIIEAPLGYINNRNVHLRNGELFENWNWVLIKARAMTSE